MLNQIKTQADYDIALERVYKLMQKNIHLQTDDISNEVSAIALKHDIAEELERISFHIESLQKLFKSKNASKSYANISITTLDP